MIYMFKLFPGLKPWLLNHCLWIFDFPEFGNRTPNTFLYNWPPTDNTCIVVWYWFRANTHSRKVEHTTTMSRADVTQRVIFCLRSHSNHVTPSTDWTCAQHPYLGKLNANPLMPRMICSVGFSIYTSLMFPLYLSLSLPTPFYLLVSEVQPPSLGGGGVQQGSRVASCRACARSGCRVRIR